MMISEKCASVCWLGIEPGMILDWKKAYDILSNHYGIENVHYFSGVSWIITSSSPVFPESGHVEINETGQVEYIQVILQNNQIPVNDLVSVFGEPEVTVIRNKDEAEEFPPCGLWQLFYPQLGLSVMVDSTTRIDYVSMMYIEKPYPVSQTQISEERERATKESIINWDERDKYCTHTTMSNP